MTTEELQLMAYGLIRAEVRRLNRKTSDSELGNYVRGIVDMQTELYKKEYRKDWSEVMGDTPFPFNKSESDAEINTFIDNMKNMRKAIKEGSKSTVEYIDSISNPTDKVELL